MTACFIIRATLGSGTKLKSFTIPMTGCAAVHRHFCPLRQLTTIKEASPHL
jgi:hypothetical protein